MKIKITKFKVSKLYIHRDRRGYLREIYQKKILRQKFLFSWISSSKKNVLRGLHLQRKFAQGKYLSVLKGEIYDVAVDLRKNSKTFGKYFSIKLSDKNGISIYLPPGFAHGFVV